MKLTIPATFWWDHYDRCAEHDGTRTIVKEHARTVVVELDADAFGDLKSDAEYYADPWGPDAIDDGGKLKRSAVATVRAIQKQVQSP
jgi:hypothetical protein